MPQSIKIQQKNTKKVWKEIAKFKGAFSMYEIAKRTGLKWNTVRSRTVLWLKEGKIHKKRFGRLVYYEKNKGAKL